MKKTVKQEEIERMRDDFIYYVENALAIKTHNSGELVDIKLNSTQIRFLEAVIEKRFNNLDIRRKHNGTKS